MTLDPSILGAVADSLALLARPEVFALMLLGNAIGLVFGVLPGIAGGMAFIVVLPLTFGWQPEVALWFLMGMLGASSFGGAIPAILINVPGDSTNAATTFDGYPMARRGEATRALGIAAMASMLGAVIGFLVLVAVLPLMRPIILAVGPPETFWLVLMGLCTLALAAQGSFLKGLAGGGIGILLSLVGISSVTGAVRFTGGVDYLWEGIQLAPLFIGLFAIAQIVEFCVEGSTIAEHGVSFTGWRRLWTGFQDVFRAKGTLVGSSMLGSVIGMIPGIGGTAAAFISYSMAKQLSKTRHLFHHGNPEGIIAAESAVNAKEFGSLVPLLSFGIPGSVEAVLVLAALILHGIQPGPFMMRDHPGVFWTILISLLVSNVFGTVIGIFVANQLARITAIRVVYLAPVIVISSLVGTYLWRGNLWDVFVAILAGAIGYGLIKGGFAIVTLMIGFLLGELAERSFMQSMAISDGNLFVFVQRPVALGILMLTLAVIVAVFWRTRHLRSEPRRAEVVS